MHLLLLLLLFALPAAACEINVNDAITSQTYRLINDTIGKCKDRPIIVRANSEGGLANPLIATMDNIKRHGKVVWIVEEPHICVSACAWLGIAAKTQRGKFIFHGITTHDGNPSPENLRLQGWLYSHGIPFSVSSQLVTRDYVEIEFK